MFFNTTLSNQLTFLRLVAIPIICGLLVLPGAIAAWAAMLLFVAAAITDYFDGYLARTRAETSTLGRVLDPIADKLLVAAVILVLVFDGRINGFTIIPAIVILLREVAVSGLREFLAEIKISLPVSRLAKWKTGIQMTAIPFIIMSLQDVLGIPAYVIGTIGTILFWAAGVLTAVTGYDYWQASKRHFAG